jgi:hypothetical protein
VLSSCWVMDQPLIKNAEPNDLLGRINRLWAETFSDLNHLLPNTRVRDIRDLSPRPPRPPLSETPKTVCPRPSRIRGSFHLSNMHCNHINSLRRHTWKLGIKDPVNKNSKFKHQPPHPSSISSDLETGN